MKTMRILMLLFIGSFAMNAQDLKPAEVPSSVSATFEKQHPNATDVEWEKQADRYVVEFEEQQMDREIWFDASGKTTKTEKELNVSNLPTAIAETLKNKYAAFTVEDAEMTLKNGKEIYFVEIENGQKEKSLRLDSTGKVLKEFKD